MSTNSPTQETEQEWRNGILQWQLRVRATFIERLAEKLEEGEDYPSDTPPMLCKCIWATAKTISEKISLIGPEHYTNVNLMLGEISGHLRYVERSRIENTPWSMIQATEDFLKKQVGKNYHFIIRPQWSHNYSVIGEFIDCYRTILSAFPSEILSFWKQTMAVATRYKSKIFDQKIFCISFPRVDRLNCLLHVNWGHEVGHIITADWKKNDFPKLWQNKQGQIRKSIEKEVRDNPPPVLALFKERAIQEMISDHTDKAMQAAKQGLDELLCDAIGLYLFGPASIASHCVFSAPYSPDENPLDRGNYPPWRYRLRLMVDGCEDIKNAPSLEKDDVIFPFFDWLRITQDVVQSDLDRKSLDSNLITKEAYAFIENSWEEIRAKVLLRLPKKSHPYNLSRSSQVIKELVKRLEFDIPPNEIGKYPSTKPASFEDILNAAWVFTIRELQKDKGWGTADDFEKLFRLILKGIESSFVHKRVYNKLKQIT